MCPGAHTGSAGYPELSWEASPLQRVDRGQIVRLALRTSLLPLLPPRASVSSGLGEYVRGSERL